MSTVRSEWTGRFCRIVEAGGFVFLAGVVARDTTVDARAQTVDVLAQIDGLLGKVGLTKADIVAANIWLSDMSNMAAMNAGWDDWVEQGNGPVRATVESKLARPDMLVEIQVQAVRT